MLFLFADRAGPVDGLFQTGAINSNAIVDASRTCGNF
jgi:hypothetical protein